MAIIRLFGLWTFLLAMVSFAVDGTKSLAANTLTITTLEEFWSFVHSSSLWNVQIAAENSLPKFIREILVDPIFYAPLWVLLGVLGVFFYWLGRKRKRTSVFIN